LAWTDLFLILLGFGAAAYGTIIGAGGGFIMVPALLLIYPDASQREVTSISLAVVFLSSISGSVAFWRRRLIDARTGVTFAAAMLPAALAGVYAVRLLPRSWFDMTFGVGLLAIAIWILSGARNRTVTVREPLIAGPGIVVRRLQPTNGVVYRYAYRLHQGLGLSAAIGFVSALFGVGGGIMQVPAMVSILRIPIEIAVATSQFTLIFMSGWSTALHALSGSFHGEELLRAALLAAGAVPGAQAGVYLGSRINRRLVVPLLALGLVAVSIRLVIAPVFD
jgi:uncharacterized membrane protein YfcA